eukprot:4121941-Lingulodinium_polyedra.AAC.1
MAGTPALPTWRMPWSSGPPRTPSPCKPCSSPTPRGAVAVGVGSPNTPFPCAPRSSPAPFGGVAVGGASAGACVAWNSPNWLVGRTGPLAMDISR